MKKMILGIVLFSTLLLGCSYPRCELHVVRSKSFVFEYYSVKAMTLHWIDDGFILVKVVSRDERYGVLSTSAEDKAKYEAKCIANNDEWYNQDIYYGWFVPNTFQDRNFSAITIISDSDFNTDYPAGTPLNDLFWFYSTSPYNYIQRGYTDEYPWASHEAPGFRQYFSNNDYANYEGDPISKRVSELVPEDLILLGGGESYRPTLAVLGLMERPTAEGTHNFVVTFTDTEGQKLVSTLKVDF